MSKVYNIYFSHSWHNSEYYENIINMLHWDGSVVFRNMSIPLSNPAVTSPSSSEYSRLIRKHILASDVIIILTGRYQSIKEWVRKEIIIARSLNTHKQILAIKPWETAGVSGIVKYNTDQIVTWDKETIVSAVHRFCSNENRPDRQKSISGRSHKAL